MAKKKKTRLGPVVRGFATTSVPKKVVLEEEVPAGFDSSTSTGEETNTQISVNQGTGDGTEPAPSEQVDSDKTEEKELQTLIDKLQDRTEKEIVRTVKVGFLPADRP